MAILQCVNVAFIAKNVSWKSLNFMLEISFNILGCKQDKKSKRRYFRKGLHVILPKNNFFIQMNF
jgi:hypothetical protein